MRGGSACLIFKSWFPDYHFTPMVLMPQGTGLSQTFIPTPLTPLWFGWTRPPPPPWSTCWQCNTQCNSKRWALQKVTRKATPSCHLLGIWFPRLPIPPPISHFPPFSLLFPSPSLLFSSSLGDAIEWYGNKARGRQPLRLWKHTQVSLCSFIIGKWDPGFLSLRSRVMAFGGMIWKTEYKHKSLDLPLSVWC